ncbi:MAG: hypothetical protein AAGF23_27735, partial [Acidobacteriota bacterium]
MFKLKLIFFCFLFAMTANSAFGLLAGSSADCDGLPGDDISCSGSVCSSLDEGPYTKGYCQCYRSDGT